MKKTLTKGNVIVEDIKIGDIHYEYEYSLGIKSEVISMPMRDENGTWHWESKNLVTNKIISYSVSEEHPHYSANLYTYEAYTVKQYI